MNYFAYQSLLQEKKQAYIVYTQNQTAYRTCACGVTTLYHKVCNDAMKYDTIVVTPSSQLSKVLAGFGCVLPVQLYGYFTHAKRKHQIFSSLATWLVNIVKVVITIDCHPVK